jgi:hypothetical protein
MGVAGARRQSVDSLEKAKLMISEDLREEEIPRLPPISLRGRGFSIVLPSSVLP